MRFIKLHLLWILTGGEMGEDDFFFKKKDIPFGGQ
jgi:hypothetical protein